jgi:myo-inositol 2-dehydrogenase/D-chiro-inositol 1-dehydrogenase
MKRVALFGAGFIGTVHGRNLAADPRVDLACIYDADASRAARLAAELGTTTAGSVEQVLEDPSVDAVVIASSTNTHADLLTASARAGKAIFCEKPIDLSLEVAEKAVAAVAETDAPVMVDFCRRFDPPYAALRKAVADGEISEVELIQMSSRGPSLPPIAYLEVSGGQMFDQLIHFFDLMCWITGLEPVSVTVTGSALVDPQVAEVGDVDTSVAVLKLSNGAICQIDAQRRIGYGYDERIEVNGSASMVEAGRQRTGWVNHYEAGQVRTDGMHPGWFERSEHTFKASIGAFIDALEAGREPSPNLADGLRAQRIANAATTSLREGRTVAID